MLRQISRFCGGVAQFIAARYAPGVVDDGDRAKIVEGLEAAINSLIAGHNADDEAHADIRALIAGLGGARLEAAYFGSGAMIPSKTSGATQGTDETGTYKVTDDYLEFSSSVDQSGEFSFKLPPNWDLGTVKAKLHWKAGEAGASAGQYVGFNVAIGATGDGDTLDRALGTAVLVADQVLAGLEAAEHVSAASAAITVGGTLAAGKRLHCKITRDADYAGGGSAMAKKARLLGIEIQFGVSGSVAAW